MLLVSPPVGENGLYGELRRESARPRLEQKALEPANEARKPAGCILCSAG